MNSITPYLLYTLFPLNFKVILMFLQTMTEQSDLFIQVPTTPDYCVIYSFGLLPIPISFLSNNSKSCNNSPTMTLMGCIL